MTQLKTTNGMIESIRKFITKDKVKALMSLGGAWKPAFKDRVGEVRNDSALSLNSDDFGVIKTWVHVPYSHLRWSSVQIKDEEWTLLMHIIKENVNDMDCTMMQQMIDARPGKKRGETVKYATKIVYENKNTLQALEKREETHYAPKITSARIETAWYNSKMDGQL